MNREEMVDEIIQTLRDEGFEGTARDERRVAERLLNALPILPQVTTVEELEALPTETIAISDRGVPFLRTGATLFKWRNLLTLKDWDSPSIAERVGPLTVVWRP